MYSNHVNIFTISTHQEQHLVASIYSNIICISDSSTRAITRHKKELKYLISQVYFVIPNKVQAKNTYTHKIQKNTEVYKIHACESFINNTTQPCLVEQHMPQNPHPHPHMHTRTHPRTHTHTHTHARFLWKRHIYIYEHHSISLR